MNMCAEIFSRCRIFMNKCIVLKKKSKLISERVTFELSRIP